MPIYYSAQKCAPKGMIMHSANTRVNRYSNGNQLIRSSSTPNVGQSFGVTPEIIFLLFKL